MPVTERREVLVERHIAASQRPQRGDVFGRWAPAFDAFGGDGLGDGVIAWIRRRPGCATQWNADVDAR
jgi:hypothetical protein